MLDARPQPLRLRAVRPRQPADRRPRGRALRLAGARRDGARPVPGAVRADRGRSRSSAARRRPRTPTRRSRSTSPSCRSRRPGTYLVSAVTKLNGTLVATSPTQVTVERDSAGARRRATRRSGCTRRPSRRSAATSRRSTRGCRPTHARRRPRGRARQAPARWCCCSPRRRSARAAVCGPVTDVAEQVKAEYGDKADFIHMEIYNDNDLEQGPATAGSRPGDLPRRAVPVRDRPARPRRGPLEGAFSVRELEAAVRKALR